MDKRIASPHAKSNQDRVKEAFEERLNIILPRDNLTSFPPITEGEEIKERVTGKFASDEEAALWFRGEKTW